MTIPQWAKNRIGYQCFVDSFAIGSGTVHDKADRYPQSVYDWQAKLLNWDQHDEKYNWGYSFYGGDLKGVENAVRDYLAGFGVDMLYLTPIFKAETNHKYDTTDYRQIDPQFGTLDDFHNLLGTCHEHNVRLLLDGVFNHTGSKHPWFLNAQQGKEPFTHYYKHNENGQFLYWNGVETLPLLDHTSPDVRRELYESPDSVVDYWLQQGADGWRLDVAEGLGQEVIRHIKTTMEQRHPEKLLIGEVMETYGKDWLGDDLLDGTMNYVFLGTTVNFLTQKIDAQEYMNELTKMYNEYPAEQLYTSWNLISSHDTDRMLFQVDGNENLFKMAVILQFTYPGVPMIYYGDELGVLYGKKDESNRRGMDWTGAEFVKERANAPWLRPVMPMDWGRVNQYSSIHFFYKHMIWLRKSSPVLVQGEFIPLYADKTLLAYLRRHKDQLVLVVINTGHTRDVKIPIPPDIRNLHKVLRTSHGPLPAADLTGESLEMTVYHENAYIFTG